MQAGVAPGNSRAVWDRAGFSLEEQVEMSRVFAEQQALARQALLAKAAQPVDSDEVVAATTANRPSGTWRLKMILRTRWV